MNIEEAREKEKKNIKKGERTEECRNSTSENKTSTLTKCNFSIQQKKNYICQQLF